MFFQKEKKANKAKLAIFKFVRKSAFIARLQPLIKLEAIMPYLQILQKYAYQGILHAEFISAMKTVQNPTIFLKNAKEQKND